MLDKKLIMNSVNSKIHINKLFLIILIFIIYYISSALVPPFQSPDEFDHVKRAYLFSRGQIVLTAPGEIVSGGLIDSGLLKYMSSYSRLPTHYSQKLSKKEISAAASIKWTGQTIFSPAPGTGYYFPLVYAPQAIGLLVGEECDLSIENSYRLARFFTFSCALFILLIAFNLYRLNILVFSLLIIPMSIFQFVSATLDSLTIALTVLCMSSFMRAVTLKYQFSRWMSYLFSISILILTTCRVYLAGLLILPIVVFFVRKRKETLWQFVFLLVFFLFWTYIAMTTTRDNRVVLSSLTTADLAIYYFSHPLATLNIFYNTFTDIGSIQFYGKSFIGLLGWLDTSFTNNFYLFSMIVLACIAVTSASLKDFKKNWNSRFILIFISLFSIFLISFALLITWTPFPAQRILGIQGRYFLTPCIIMAYAIGGDQKSPGNWITVISLLLFLTLLGMVVVSMPQILLERYFIIAE